MKTVGIVCEYNPFHNGHKKQFDWIRAQLGAQTAIVCLMSGNYVQRGEPAVFDRQIRAEAALSAGADLVLELPITCALSSAEGFADGAVDILERLGVEYLCFGAECDDISEMEALARLLLTEEFAVALRAELETRCSFASARQRAVERLGGNGALLERPNNILAVEYCKAIARRHARIQPLVLKRAGDYHAESLDTENPAASAMRANMDSALWDACTPAAELFRSAQRHTLQIGERAVLARLYAMTQAEFSTLPFGAEGLWRALYKACRTERSIEAILNAAKSKRYARARLQRMLLCAFLGITEADLQREAAYIRILGFSDSGRRVLRELRKCTPIPLVHAGETPPESRTAELEARATRLYQLFAEDMSAAQTERVVYWTRDSEKQENGVQPRE